MISVGKYMKNYSYFYKAFSEKDITNNSGALLIRPSVPTKVFITIHQKHKKFFDDNFAYKVLRLLIGEVETGQEGWQLSRTLKVAYKAQQVCCIEVDLQPRSYLILGQMAGGKAKLPFANEAFTISIYS